MYKVIGADGKEYGPVTAEQLQQWIRENRANAQTLVQAEDSADWRPLHQVPEFSAVLQSAAAATSPASAAPPVPPAELAARDYTLDLGGYLSRGWSLFKANMGLFIGVGLLYLAVWLVLGLIGIIPFVGLVSSVAQIILAGPLVGGLYWVFILRARGLAATVGDLFAGFSRAFGNLILAQVVSSLLALVGMLPGAFLVGAGVALLAGSGSGSGVHAVGLALAVGGGVLLVIGVGVAIYLSVCWMFALPLVIDRQMGFWEAMGLSRAQVRKHWWGVFGCTFVLGLVSMAGLLACGVGLLFTIPLAFAAIVCMYEDLFGGNASPV